ncbi:MAG: 1-phosphofructokinase family hexose kinase [Herbiconiux sp.]|uniref:1-phosphofructokinase family hexose kinase n=1 Tax=Herbiconiux sp. TaxID=1871186 RepID=UPI001229B81B|nr:1-phosphofructokinase family hexose kinase [Herbiconiux sp.]TAJ48012.1 MAG: 1-phosphofructokinase family hexose kinase [Herbiconiux sp.]
MILTVTVNPSFDRTIDLAEPLQHGQVQRVSHSTQEPGGKGVNVSRALQAAGCATLAILPGDAGDPMVEALGAAGIPVECVPVGASIRANTTITEPDGTTTKLNEPGAPISPDALDGIVDLVARRSAAASWVVLAGSLPPGAPADFYARIVAAIRQRAARDGVSAPSIAVDSSGDPLSALLSSGETVDLIKPNGEELLAVAGALGEPVAGIPVDDFEADEAQVVAVAQSLLSPTLGRVLVTLGSRGALLVSEQHVLAARAPVIVARSTVGAGDCSLAGYLLATERGAAAAEALAQAVAHGAAAASLPGSTVPTPDLTHPGDIVVSHRPRVVAGRR